MQVAATTAYKAEMTQEEATFKDTLGQEQAQLNQAIQNAGTPDDGTGNNNGSNGSNLSFAN